MIVSPKFKYGDLVYYIGTKMQYVQRDKAYVVIDYKSPQYDMLNVCIKGDNNKYEQIDEDDLVSELEYNKMIQKNKMEKNKENFKIGDEVYYIGNNTTIKKNIKYTIISFSNQGIAHVKSTDNTKYGSPEYHHIDLKYLITKDEYFKLKDIEIKNNKTFKKGEIVYYIGDSTIFNKNEPYEVIIDSIFKGMHDGMKIYSVTVKSMNGRVSVEDAINFQSKEEYLKSFYGPNKYPFIGSSGKTCSRCGNTIINKYCNKCGARTEPKEISYPTSFTSGLFSIGDVVYYVGKRTKHNEHLISKTKPYIVCQRRSIANSREQLIGIKADDGELLCFPEKDFVSEYEYKTNKDKYYDDSDDKDDIHINLFKPKEDTTIRLNLFRDTNKGKLIWFKPYTNLDEWYRATIKIEGLKEGYLRFDVKREKKDWEIYIYFHRNKFDSSTLVRVIKETESLKKLVKKIQDIVDSQEAIKFDPS
jgi:hypothetical protein